MMLIRVLHRDLVASVSQPWRWAIAMTIEIAEAGQVARITAMLPRHEGWGLETLFNKMRRNQLAWTGAADAQETARFIGEKGNAPGVDSSFDGPSWIVGDFAEPRHESLPHGDPPPGTSEFREVH